MNPFFRTQFAGKNGIFLICWLLLGGCAPSTGNYLIPRPDPALEVKDKVGDINLVFKPQVDILFVVDSSGSMDSHQNNLSKNISLFTNSLGKIQILDYHIGVTTTDFTYGDVGALKGVPKFVERSTPDGLAQLSSNLLVGISGSPYESVFAPTRAALSQPNLSGANRGFYRDDAYLAVVFVTDAADQSNVTAGELFQFLMDLKNWEREKLIAYGVIVPSHDDSCSRDEVNSKPSKIEEFLQMSKGISFSLCAPDYGERLAAIGEDLVKRVGMFIPLKQIPVVSTIQVRYGSQVIPEASHTGWSYDPFRVGINLGTELELEEQVPGTELEIGFIPALVESPQ